MISKMLVAAGAMIAFAAPAAAQSFEGEIDCNDVWQQGDSVPWTVRFEEQAFQQHSIDVTVFNGEDRERPFSSGNDWDPDDPVTANTKPNDANDRVPRDEPQFASCERTGQQVAAPAPPTPRRRSRPARRHSRIT